MGAHQRDRILAAEEDGIDIHRLDLLEHIVILVLDRAERSDACIVDQHVETTHRVMRGGEHFLPACFIGDIMLERKGRALAVGCVDFGGHLFCACAIHIRQCDPGTFFGEHLADGLAEALRAAGDECHFSLNPAHACFLLIFCAASSLAGERDGGQSHSF